jgi:hypothetical protein
VNYVYYAGYGSNLMRERFLCYIKGGRPPGSVVEERGCRDKTDPLRDRPVRIAYPLYFSRYSPRWGGGVAFLGHERGKKATLGRMYLISEEQFTDVLRQENGNDQLTVDFARLRLCGSLQVSSSWYGRILALDDCAGYPVLTITAGRPYSAADVTAPSLGYLEVMASGLRQAYAMSGPEIARYLGDKPGIKEYYSLRELACL